MQTYEHYSFSGIDEMYVLFMHCGSEMGLIILKSNAKNYKGMKLGQNLNGKKGSSKAKG